MVSSLLRHAVLADTGPLYALSDSSDQYHQRATRAFGHLQEQQLTLILCYPIVCETHKLIQRHLGLPLAQRWLAVVLEGANLLNPKDEDYLAAWAIMQRYSDQAITLFDATVATLSERLDTPVWTFDHHFDLMGVAVWRGG